MKKIALALATFVCAGFAEADAQTMKVYRGKVITAIPAATVGDALFTEGGNAFSVSGNNFSVAEVNQILIDRTDVQPRSVSVNYSPDGPWVTVSADVAPYLDIQITDGHVRIVAALDYLQEISYTLTGNSANGSFYMDGAFKSKVTLSDLTLTNPTGSAIEIANGKRIDVIIPTGTTTTLADGAGGLHSACFFVNGHAEFKGGGVLNLVGNSKHAYASDEYTILKPGFGTINVTSACGDGMHVEQYFDMYDGKVNISGTKGDCIDVGITKDPLDLLNGQVFVRGGSLNLQVASDDIKGLKSDSLMTISGGSIQAEVSGLGTKGISAGTGLFINQTSGNPTQIKMNVTGTTYMPGDLVLQSKCRGIKVKGDLHFDGGDINMTVTGVDAKGISINGTYYYTSGTTNVLP